MSSPRVLILLGHPDTRSFGGAIAQAYQAAATQAGCEVELLHVAALEFDATPRGRPPELEPSLEDARRKIREASHLVLVYPTWLGAMPARMKGFFERVFSDNFAFRFKEGSNLPERLLKGRSADVLVTMDTPPWAYRWLIGAPGHRMVQRSILAPAGIGPTKVMSIGPLKSSSDERRQRWLEAVKAQAEKRCSRLESAAVA